MGTGSALFPGRVISSNTPGVTIPSNTLVSSTNNNGEGVFITGLIDGGPSGSVNVFYRCSVRHRSLTRFQTNGTRFDDLFCYVLIKRTFQKLFQPFFTMIDT